MLRKSSSAFVLRPMCSLAIASVIADTRCFVAMSPTMKALLDSIQDDMNQTRMKLDSVGDNISKLKADINSMNKEKKVRGFNEWVDRVKKNVVDVGPHDVCRCVDVSCSGTCIDASGSRYAHQCPFYDIYKADPYTLCLCFQISGGIVPLFNVNFKIQQDSGIKISTKAIKGRYQNVLSHRSTSDWSYECYHPADWIMRDVERKFKRYALKPDVHDQYVSATEQCLRLLLAKWQDIRKDSFGYYDSDS